MQLSLTDSNISVWRWTTGGVISLCFNIKHFIVLSYSLIYIMWDASNLDMDHRPRKHGVKEVIWPPLFKEGQRLVYDPNF